MTSRGIDPFDKRAMGLSAGLHMALFTIAWLSTLDQPSELQFITYEIEMVSPPPAVQAEEVEQATEELVVERPDPDPAPPEPEAEEVVPVEEPEDEQPDPPREEREEPAEQRPEPDEEVTMAAAPEEVPEEAPEESGEGINVRIEGLRRDYPAYYENIIRQIFRCLRWREGGSWETTIFFWITRDGTATDIEFEKRSGNNAIDFEAMGAVDCAGRGRFGPLPEDLPYDRFPVRFKFSPAGGARGFFPAVGQPAEVTSE